ncbi:MAG: ECF transporter S component [Candidatus Zixiibacteriota bacterium]
MSVAPRMIARVALFSALIYVLSWSTSYLPNINLIFFIVFTAGFVWGAVAGALVGAIGMALWTTLNPYGPAGLPVMVAQVVGAAASGPVGFIAAKADWRAMSNLRLLPWLVLAAIICTLAYYLPVNVVDAWIYQPFWPRFVVSMLWTLVSLGFNLLIFPLLFGVTRFLYLREHARL